MFSAKTNNHIDFDTVISARTEIRGDVTVKGAIQIDGVLKGNLIAEPGSKASVRISDKGRVKGGLQPQMSSSMVRYMVISMPTTTLN